MELIQQAAAVTAVMLLLAGALWWAKGRGLASIGGGRRAERRMEAVERLALGPQHGLWLVRVGGRGILVGISPSGCSVLESGEWSRFEALPQREVRP
jgi:flagellar biogenesis protein FliO